jgi:PilZ domain
MVRLRLAVVPEKGQGERMDSDGVFGATNPESPRARRYEIGTALRFRVRGEREWHEGLTENISISGMLIRTGRALEPKTAIEMRFFLPVELDGEYAAEVFCRGFVIRSSKCRIPAGTYTIAAKIMHSRFLRQMGSRDYAAKDSMTGYRRLVF